MILEVRNPPYLLAGDTIQRLTAGIDGMNTLKETKGNFSQARKGFSQDGGWAREKGLGIRKRNAEEGR